jgi:hypothetical protein
VVRPAGAGLGYAVGGGDIGRRLARAHGRDSVVNDLLKSKSSIVVRYTGFEGEVLASRCADARADRAATHLRHGS